MEIQVTRNDSLEMLQAKVLSSMRSIAQNILAAGKQPETPEQLFAAAIRLGDKTLAGISPTVLEDPDKIGWSVPICKSGCHYCCYEQVNVTPPEVFTIETYIKNHWPDDRQRSLRKRLQSAAAKAQNLGQNTYYKARIACPLLNAQGMCSIYEVRPLMCRAYNSLDLKRCERAAKLAHKPVRERGVPANGSVHGVFNGVYSGLRKGLEVEQLQSHLPMLVVALQLVFDDATLKDRWLKGDRVFG
ncbi:YkgJ family cysteine cluster protein [Candidatus Thiothrix sp. Deng01]|uniref:YkgJ family cysteine cluster protein n=1 Tax=Candidatus Thiothrix phosphatis TaxID=3112415 RepID=A0ABU6CZ13_9GAMM|nr:YkgJ family cysteine cluster protein [Candidatus Thiothrix sp. Deng01]MEB4591334.1 YkgJ family cysteine cluster protein [Candidatus Thiothrix sp. Deng01]